MRPPRRRTWRAWRSASWRSAPASLARRARSISALSAWRFSKVSRDGGLSLTRASRAVFSGTVSLTSPASTPCRSGGARARACEGWPLRASCLDQVAVRGRRLTGLGHEPGEGHCGTFGGHAAPGCRSPEERPAVAAGSETRCAGRQSCRAPPRRRGIAGNGGAPLRDERERERRTPVVDERFLACVPRTTGDYSPRAIPSSGVPRRVFRRRC